MNINDSVLSYAERLNFSLRELYSQNGYQPYRMSKFEDYDRYRQTLSAIRPLLEDIRILGEYVAAL